MRTCCDRVVDVFLTSLFWEGRLRNYQCNRKRAVLSGFGMGLVLGLSCDRDRQNGIVIQRNGCSEAGLGFT